MNDRRPTTFPFPLAVIDFEASSLDPASYPIEVGVAVGRNESAIVDTWATLIAPYPTWELAGAWDTDAERLHGIKCRDVTGGLRPAQVVDHLNQLLAGIPVVLCGDSKYDRAWFATLCNAAPAQPIFELQGIDDLVARGSADHQKLTAMLASLPTPHRAGPDAERLCRAIRALVDLGR